MLSLSTVKNVIIQGVTGRHGSFHARSMVAAGTNIVAGTSPDKAGQTVDTIPVYNTVANIQKDFNVDASVIFVPAKNAKAAMIEAIDAGISVIVCITEGVPVHDMLTVKTLADQAGVHIIGPNCPGILIPGQLKLGIIPEQMGTPGTVGIVSRSGTLTYEAAAELSARGIGQKYIIGIGGDRIQGTSYNDCLELFQNDPDVSSIVLIGEIGGSSEQKAAAYIKAHITKPVFAYIAGHSAPLGIQLGHAGAILNNPSESATAKTTALKNAGAFTATSLGELIVMVK
jgi:succinyl-CoA synthetase alpha subunit